MEMNNNVAFSTTFDYYMVEKETVMSQVYIIKDILNKNHGYITAQDVCKAGIPTAVLYRYAKANGLIKYAPGFYAESNWLIDVYLIFQYSYPKYIYSFDSAIFLHELGDILPSYFEVTGPKNYRPISKPRKDIIAHTNTRDDVYSLGITKVATTSGNFVKVYDLEKTICDLIKNKNKLELEVYAKAIHAYCSKKNKRIDKLFEYAKAMKIESDVSTIFEVLLNED
ncbi:MAG: hypothetical protein MJ248_01305 [Bacilli bacterium]|nr:hypothetical protein [Bacilli bacterium]